VKLLLLLQGTGSLVCVSICAQADFPIPGAFYFSQQRQQRKRH
jgi:hypothetical protein